MSADVGEKKDGVNGINITPLVDVCLVLVLIFMITMPYSILRGIDVRREMLKKYGLSEPQQSVTAHLTLNGILLKKEDGKETPVPDKDLPAVLAGMLEGSKDKKFYLQVDLEVSHGRTVWSMDQAKQAGASEISLVEG
jgi:biopolymer transport protein ExbD